MGTQAAGTGGGASRWSRAGGGHAPGATSGRARLRLVAPRERELTALPFDQYQRYRLVADLVENAASAGERLSVLDVGGRTGILRRFLPGHDVALVDLERSGERGLVLGDAAALPFGSRSFDVVVACDTLEHLPARAREAACAEAARVARRLVVLAGPYATEGVALAEQRLRAYLHDELGFAHRYLDEHAEHGLPDLDATERALARAGARTARFGHGNLARWLAWIALSLYLDRDGDLREGAEALHRSYNEGLYEGDLEGPFYRHAVVAALGGHPLPELGHAPHAPADPPTDALTPVALAIAAFERARGVQREERARFRRAVRDLERDLEGHRSALSALGADLDGHRAALADARARLSEHEAALACVGADLEGHRGHRATLERDLEEHRRHARALEEELARERAERLAERRAAEDPGVPRGWAARERVRLEAELAAERAESQRLRAALSSRWGCLARALGARGTCP